jgi:hypothetical protein
MASVSGVSGAGPILHEVFEHLHERYGTTWYSKPTNIVECWIDPVTGKRRADEAGVGSGAIKEKFMAQNLPPPESPDDYVAMSNSKRAVRFGSEYREWFATGDNWLGDSAVLADTSTSPRILFPPPGTILFLDADLPGQGRLMSLRAIGPEHVQWFSDSLSLAQSCGRDLARLTEGRHQIIARDPISGAEARTWIEVRQR